MKSQLAVTYRCPRCRAPSRLRRFVVLDLDARVTQAGNLRRACERCGWAGETRQFQAAPLPQPGVSA
jgi:hypothetical protein